MWILEGVALSVWSRLIAEHGGLPGVTDRGGVSSALNRARHVWASSEEAPGLEELAASYAGGILRDPPLVDSNKRLALALCLLFLDRNGRRVAATQEEKYRAIMDLAQGRLPEARFAAWLRAHAQGVVM